MKDLRIVEVKKLDKMHPGSVKYWKRLTLSNSEDIASDYEEEEKEEVCRLLYVYPHSRLDSIIS